MIPSNPNPPMTQDDIVRFRSEMARKLKGEYSVRERELYENAKRTYDRYMAENDGKNPFFNV